MLNDLIGIPFVDRQASLRGADCFGLARLYYCEILNISIFKHKSKYDNIKGVIMEYLHESKTNWHNVDTPKKHDIIAMAHDIKHPDIIQHFGIYLGDGKMLHTLKEIGSHIVEVDEYKYFIKAIHRHNSFS